MKDTLIVALDFPTAEEALALVDTLGETVGFYKVGMEMFYSAGPNIIKELKSRNKKVFLDLKLHDIPNTVGESIRALVKYGVDIITVHGTGGYSMLRRAKEVAIEEAKQRGIPAPKIIAITVLTSISPVEWEELGYTRGISDQAGIIAKVAKSAGVDGVVCSPEEARFIRDAVEEFEDTGLAPKGEFLVITPGIRLTTDDANDQSRVATPSQALANGASYLVVGRPIRCAADPKQAAEEILKEMGQN